MQGNDKMRTILLSFKPVWYEQIMKGNKVYEYRWQFPPGEVMAYIYVSRPVQEIIGYMYFSNKTSISELMRKYNDNLKILSDLEKKAEHNRFVMEILGYQKTKPIKILDIKKEFPNFVIPQSYYYLDNFPELFKFIKENSKFEDNMIFNDLDSVPIETIGTGLINPFEIS